MLVVSSTRYSCKLHSNRYFFIRMGWIKQGENFSTDTVSYTTLPSINLEISNLRDNN